MPVPGRQGIGSALIEKALRQAEAGRGDLTAGSFPKGELVLASYALAEIAGVCQAEQWRLATWDIDAGLSIAGATMLVADGADVLVMESTYGNPCYRLPPREQWPAVLRTLATDPEWTHPGAKLALAEKHMYLFILGCNPTMCHRRLQHKEEAKWKGPMGSNSCQGDKVGFIGGIT